MLSPYGTWPVMENVRAKKCLKGYLILYPCLLDKETDLPPTVVAEPVVESISLSSQPAKPTGLYLSELSLLSSELSPVLSILLFVLFGSPVDPRPLGFWLANDLLLYYLLLLLT